VEEEKNKKINIKNNLNLNNINSINNKINNINNVNSEKNISLNELIKSNENLNENKQNKNKNEQLANINYMSEANKLNNNKIVEEEINILNEQRVKNKNTFNKIQESFNIEIENNNLNNLNNIISLSNINSNSSLKGTHSNGDISNLKLINNNSNNNNNNEEIEYTIKNDKINIEVNYGNIPKLTEKGQYKKIEIKNEGSQSGHQNSGCIKKIEVSNNLKLNMNGQHDNSSSNSNLIDWEFNNTNNSNSNSNILFQYNKINIIEDDKNANNEIFLGNKDSNKSLKSVSNRNKSPLSNNLMNSLKKDDLFNSSEFNSNINDGIIEEKDLNINEPERNDGNNEKYKISNNSNANSNKDLSELNDKKSRNNNDNENKNVKKEEIKENKENILNNNSNNDSNNKQTNNSSNMLKSFEENNYNINLNLSNSFINNKNNNNNISTLSNNSGISNNNLRYNNSEINNPNLNKDNLNDIKISLINENNTPKKIFTELSDEIINKITNDLCQQIISNILISEIKDKKKVLFKKKKGINTSLNNSSASLRISQNSMSIGSHSPGRNYPVNKNVNLVNNNDSYQTISSANNSQAESVLNNSIFMRTIDEIKKEKTLNLYNDKIAPLLIEKIEENIGQNYEKIINNLKVPHKIDEAKMINGLMLKDRNLSITSKIRFCNDDIMKDKFVEENVLNDFEKIDKEIRNNDNIVSDNYYDKILNKCVYDTTNELIEKRRQYGIIGQPLSWSIRTRDIDFKYKNNDKYSKSIFTQAIIKEVKKIIDTKMGLIAENYEYLDMDQLNQDRDKKFMESIMKELKDDEDYYQIFETQETYVKLSLSRIIMDQLLNEIVEILEHVQYSRKEPDKYQSKSIYACEDIPRLSFQPQTMENNYTGNYEGDGEGDESINQ